MVATTPSAMVVLPRVFSPELPPEVSNSAMTASQWIGAARLLASSPALISLCARPPPLAIETYAALAAATLRDRPPPASRAGGGRAAHHPGQPP
ncbi:hypothetical protein F750_2595 [Streptomyces sp. PAMC 26508]|nr:hypothetical protein F750_2595 [Streptomyces sp. PAMC 26508]